MKSIADKYDIVRQLGTGGWATVYLVRHRDLGLEFALKLLNRDLSEDPTFVESFRKEAEVLSRFSHHGSAQLRDFGRTPDGLYYMTTEFCSGETLEVKLKREQWMPVLDSLKMMIQILDVVSSAHLFGIVHRDIKPGNIMVQYLGSEFSIKLVDFGLSYIIDHSGSAETTSAEIVSAGTPQYMSPEQASGQQDLDNRVDIYALGAVLYEMITGVPPFQGDSIVSILVKHLTQPVPKFADELGVPAEVEQLTLKALAKNPAERFQTAEEFQTACKFVLEHLEGMTHEAESHAAFINSAKMRAQATKNTNPSPPILCLDDNETLLTLVKHILEIEGYRVFTATEFSAIHDLIFREGCGLMLCDVEMPGISGVKVCQLLKKSNPELQIVLFSNLPERDLEKLAVEANADTWLSKQARPAEWLSTVKGMLPLN